MVIPVVIAFTPNYFVPAATMLRSLLDSSEGTFHVICMVTEDIPERMKDELLRMGGDRLEMEYLNLGGRLAEVYTDPRYSEAASYRLLLPDLLPEYDRVLYIDCDIIVRQDVARLFADVDLGDAYLGVVREAAIEQQAERWKALGCNPNEYFNSGFLLMNLKQMRADGLTEKFLEASKVDWLEFPDQDVLNKVCGGRVVALPPQYNAIRTFFIPQYKADFLRQYSLEDWECVQREGTIHYTGGKPWNIFSVRFADWWRTYERLPHDIRAEWKPDARISLLWKIYRIPLCRNMVDGARSLVRRIRN